MNQLGEVLMAIMEREGIQSLPEFVALLNEERKRYDSPPPEVTSEYLATLMTAAHEERPWLSPELIVLMRGALRLSEEKLEKDRRALAHGWYCDQGGAFDSMDCMILEVKDCAPRAPSALKIRADLTAKVPGIVNPFDERGGLMEAQDSNGTRIQLTDEGVTYGEEFVAFDEMGGVTSIPQDRVGNSPFDVTVILKNGPPDLVIRDLPEHIATPLRQRLDSILLERYM
jgi:hypothetical protein